MAERELYRIQSTGKGLSICKTIRFKTLHSHVDEATAFARVGMANEARLNWGHLAKWGNRDLLENGMTII